MDCPHCNKEIGHIVLIEYAFEYGYVKLPSTEWLAEFFKPIENNRCDADDVAQALSKKLIAGDYQALVERLPDASSKP